MAPQKIAFLGLGAMGFGMSTNLVTKNHTVTGYDIYAPTLAKFRSRGGLTATTPASTVTGAKYIIFMVATAAQIVSALFDSGTDSAVNALEKNAVVILCSTGPPGYSLKVRGRLDALGRTDVGLLDAPVSGGTIRAADGTLTVLASGEQAVIEDAREVLMDLAGKNLYVIPGGLGAGTKVKMVHQVLAGVHIVSASEATGFGARLGLESRAAFEGLKGGEGSSWMFENRVPHMLVRDERIYSALNIIVKDMGIVTAGGRGANFPLFLSSTVDQVLATGVSAGYGLEDDARLVKVYLPQQHDLVRELASDPSTPSTLSPDDPKLKLVQQVMSGIHVAAAAEAMSLGARVGLDQNTMYEIIKGAAGSSWAFRDRVPQLLSGKWTSRKTVNETIAELSEAIDEAHKTKYPLHLAGTALQLFQLAQLKGWGDEPDLAVSRVWDGPDGTLFPRSV